MQMSFLIRYIITYILLKTNAWANEVWLRIVAQGGEEGYCKDMRL